MLKHGVFAWRASTGSDAFFPFKLYPVTFVLLTVFTHRDDLPENLGKTAAQK